MKKLTKLSSSIKSFFTNVKQTKTEDWVKFGGTVIIVGVIILMIYRAYVLHS